MSEQNGDALDRLLESLPTGATFGPLPEDRRGLPWKPLVRVYCPGMEGQACSVRIAEVLDTPAGALFVSAYRAGPIIGVRAVDRPARVGTERLGEYRHRTGNRYDAPPSACFLLLEHPDIEGRPLHASCNRKGHGGVRSLGLGVLLETARSARAQNRRLDVSL